MKVVNILNGEVSDKDFQTSIEFEIDGKVAPMDDFSITETAYIPPQVQIKDFMDAGVRLNAERRARFDNRELDLGDQDDIPLDPMREPNVDIVDVQRAARQADANIEKTKRQILAELKAQEEAIKSGEGKDTAGAQKVDPGASSEVKKK